MECVPVFQVTLRRSNHRLAEKCEAVWSAFDELHATRTPSSVDTRRPSNDPRELSRHTLASQQALFPHEGIIPDSAF